MPDMFMVFIDNVNIESDSSVWYFPLKANMTSHIVHHLFQWIQTHACVQSVSEIIQSSSTTQAEDRVGQPLLSS